MKKIFVSLCLFNVVISVLAQPQYNNVADMLNAVQNPAVLRRATTLKTLGVTSPSSGPIMEWRWDSTNTLSTNAIRLQIGTNNVGRLVHDWDGNVDVFGPKGDGITIDQTAVQAAADAATDRLYFPAGKTYLMTGSLLLRKSNLTVDLMGTLKAHTNNISDQILVYDGTNGLANPRYDALSNAIPVYSNLVFNGHGVGVIDGNCVNRPTIFNTNGTAQYGGFGMNVYGVRNLVIKGLTILDTPTWALNVAFSTNILISQNNIGIMQPNSTNFPGKNQDGIHVIDSIGIRITENHVQSSDDCIVATTYRHPVRNMVVSDNVLRHVAFVSPWTSYLVPARNFALAPETTYGECWELENITFSKNLCWGNAGGMALWNNLAAGFTNKYYIRNLSITDNKFFGLQDTRTNFGFFTYMVQMGRCDNVRVAGNSFIGMKRFYGFEISEDWRNITFENNTFAEWEPNPFAPAGGVHAVINAVLSSTRTGQNMRVVNNTFDRITGAALRMTVGTPGTYPYTDVEFKDNVIKTTSSPLTNLTGQSALFLGGVKGSTRVQGNRFSDVDGAFLETVNVDDLTIENNVFEGLRTNRSSALSISAIPSSFSNLLGRVQFKRNTLKGVPFVGTYFRNFSRSEVEENMFENWALINSSSAVDLGFSAAIDGGVTNAPPTTNITGVIRGNFARGAAGRNGIITSRLNVPTIATPTIFVYDNLIVGGASQYNIDGDIAIGYQPMDNRVGLGRSSVSPSGFFHHVFQTETASSNSPSTIGIERYYNGTGFYTDNKIGVSVVNRLEGTNGGSGFLYGINNSVTINQTGGQTNGGIFADVTSMTVGPGTNRASLLINNLLTMTAVSNLISDSRWGVQVSRPTLGGATNIIGNYGGINIEPQYYATVSPQSSNGPSTTPQYSLRSAGTNDILQVAGFFRLSATSDPTNAYLINLAASQNFAVPTNNIAIYVVRDGAGKAQLRVMFSDGTTTNLATQP